MAPNDQPNQKDCPSGDQPQASNGNGQHREMPRTTFAQLGLLTGELREYASYFLSTRIDAAKLSARKIGLYAALGALGAIAGATALVTAVVLLLGGAATGLGVLFGGRIWLGNLLMGLLVLASFAAGAWFVVSSITRSSQRRTVKKYEERQQRQHEQFGRNIEQAAALQRVK